MRPTELLLLHPANGGQVSGAVDVGVEDSAGVHQIINQCGAVKGVVISETGECILKLPDEFVTTPGELFQGIREELWTWQAPGLGAPFRKQAERFIETFNREQAERVIHGTADFFPYPGLLGPLIHSSRRREYIAQFAPKTTQFGVVDLRL